MIEFEEKVPVKEWECYECFSPTTVTYKFEEVESSGFKRVPFTYFKPVLNCTNPDCGTIFAAPEHRRFLTECLDIAAKEFYRGRKEVKMGDQLEQLVKTFESYDKLRSDGIKFNEPEVVAMCDRRMDALQDRIIEAKEKLRN